MAETTNIQTGTPQFGKVEYLVQMSLNSVTAKVLQVQHISNPQLSLQFQKRSKDILTLDSWVDCTAANGFSNDIGMIKSICQSGFNIPPSGMKFSVGQFDKDSFENDRMSGTKVVKRMILCEIAVGRSFNCNSSKVQVQNIPIGYDSLLIKDKYSAEEDLYNFEYILKDSNQVLPKYIVTFEYDPVVEHRSRQKPNCDNCDNHMAVVHCEADNANLCNDCDSDLHMANKVAMKHVRVPIGKGGKEWIGCCRIHADQKVEFFCAQCCLPVCVHCKMIGHHSNGEAAKHLLVSILDAFETVNKESVGKDKILKNRSEAIMSQTEKLRHRRHQIESQKKKLALDIEQLYKQSLQELETKIQEKITVLESDEYELSRQQKEINMVENFLEYQKSGNDMFNLLFNWDKHQNVLQRLREFQFFRESIDVYPDLKIAGKVTFIEDEKNYKVQSPISSPMKPKLLVAEPYSQTNSPVTTKKNKVQSSQSLVSEKNCGVPVKVQTKRNPMRRTSDFFAETLSVLDDIAIDNSTIVNDTNESEFRFKFVDEDC